MQSKVKVGTHDGVFHCDEVLACAMLTRYTDAYKDAEIVRSRDEKILDQCDVVVDVSGKHQPPKYFDHHQRQFTGTHPDHNIRLSSAGLVYLHFPEIIPNVIRHILDTVKLPFEPVYNEDIQKEVRSKIYEGFIMGVDAIDNGVEICEGKKNYNINSALWNRIGRLNPMWWEESVNQIERFKQAMEMANEELVMQVKHSLLGGIQTKEIIRQAFNQRQSIHESGQIVVLKKFVPWQSSLVSLEKQCGKEGEVKFVLYPEHSGKAWRVQAVASSQGSFTLRKGLKEQWRGIKDIELLAKNSSIHDIVFVHNNGFIGGAKSYESALKMAIESL